MDKVYLLWFWYDDGDPILFRDAFKSLDAAKQYKSDFEFVSCEWEDTYWEAERYDERRKLTLHYRIEEIRVRT